ncbi:succinylglutamate desuccinylase/aspartoacylase family protein [Halomicroarcula limicola]|uniref:Succinylglutamate desuccinylase/aspartoacylase family protein n=1 Tax=Haloarcula limicola TaxID=1429915 RepID=A0A8J7YCD4_9EURY|nr:succinylglutamate desuccinylase/aspartoacylase family protein [Halomicroarcula limicola]MBV0924666.1 succinylglutamate desuccinylase/aspartoacylase family protein [Halomicroarcula limicola]
MPNTVSPDVTMRGPTGERPLTVVAGVHGDEQSGVRAVERVLDAGHEFERAVRFVTANPPAVDAGERYLDVDMNRVFPGDADSEDRERRLAAELLDIIGDAPAIALHATHATSEPISLVSREQPGAVETAAGMATTPVVDTTDTVEGGLNRFGQVVTVETGKQGTEEAVETGVSVVEAFLRFHGALPGETPDAAPTFYQEDSVIEKPDDAPEDATCEDLYDLHVENFERVDEGDVWATVDGEELIAEEAFIPILMSECGYDDIFGYKGHVAGETLSTAREHWDLE